MRNTVLAHGWPVLGTIPELPARWGCARVADHVWRRRGAGVRQLEANLRRVVGPQVCDRELRALSRRGMRSYLRYFYEVVRLPAMRPHEIRHRTHVTGLASLQEALRSGRGVVVALPHMGNWDHAGAWITLRGFPLTTVAERLRPPELYERFSAIRSALGMEVLALDRGEASTVATLTRRLRAGGLVCLLADRDLTGGGVEVGLFGEPARFPLGPARLAHSTGAALVPVTLTSTGHTWHITIHPRVPRLQRENRVVEWAAMTQQLAGVFATAIAEHPEDWHMLQPVFAADLPAPGPGLRSPMSEAG